MNSDRVSHGESASEALLVAQMRPALVKYFRRKCGSTEEAEDLAQDVLVRALAHGGWKSPEQAKGYIFRAAVNRWHDRRRRDRTHGVTVQWDEDAASRLGEEITPERVLVIEQAFDHVVAALLELNDRTRDVFILIRLEQMKQSAVAEMLGISVSAVEKHLVKALAHLARRAGQADLPQ